MTYAFEAPDAKATLVFIPGGEGHRGVKPDWTANHGYFSTYHYNVMLRSLSNPAVTSGQFNVVIFDSPAELRIARHWSSERTGTDHLSRVEDVVRYYKERLGKPVWLMGHSMGSISVTELYKRLQGKKGDDLVAGLIVSGGAHQAARIRQHCCRTGPHQDRHTIARRQRPVSVGLSHVFRSGSRCGQSAGSIHEQTPSLALGL